MWWHNRCIQELKHRIYSSNKEQVQKRISLVHGGDREVEVLHRLLDGIAQYDKNDEVAERLLSYKFFLKVILSGIIFSISS